jgi:hypothetical protein
MNRHHNSMANLLPGSDKSDWMARQSGLVQFCYVFMNIVLREDSTGDHSRFQDIKQMVPSLLWWWYWIKITNYLEMHVRMKHFCNKCYLGWLHQFTNGVISILSWKTFVFKRRVLSPSVRCGWSNHLLSKRLQYLLRDYDEILAILAAVASHVGLHDYFLSIDFWGRQT